MNWARLGWLMLQAVCIAIIEWVFEDLAEQVRK